MPVPRLPLTLLIALALGSPWPSTQAAELDAAVSRTLQREGQVDVLLRLQPALLPALSSAVGPAGQRVRTQQVVAALRKHAARTQAPLLQRLEAMRVPATPLWLDNSIAVHLDASHLHSLQGHPGLWRIDSDAPRALSPDAPVTVAKLATEVEAHLTAMRVPEAWALGARGRGVVVGGQDSGYDVDHPALAAQYRGREANGSVQHDHHWYDGVRASVHSGFNRCGYASATPCDDDAHGTHTMGTAVGDGGDGARIGVATEAEWIGCRNMDRGVGRPSTYLACFQFLLAPTRVDGSDPRPELAPAVTVNSWGCPLGPPPSGEECASDSFDIALAAAAAAGQLTVVAAGNGTPLCGSINMPPSTSADALVIGATDNLGNIAPFSLWGPVATAGGALMKPDLSGPGVAVRSSVPGGQYARFSGTSMATPGVAGVAALMLGANPLLIGQPQASAALLKGSAVPTFHPGSCFGAPGQQSPNPMFGHGRVDALAAVNAATTLAVSPAHAGAWYDPARAGEGWILQIDASGTAALVWYSFTDSGEQAWFIAADGAIAGPRIRFDTVSAVQGGRFGEAFDPAALRYDAVGSLVMDFADCDNATLRFTGDDSLPDAQVALSRLTQLRGLPCGRPLQPTGERQASRSGAWYDPARAGEGWLIDALDDDRVALTWFTFDPDGAPAWLYGVGTLDATSLQIDDLRRVEGGGFGGDFDPATLRDTAWGRLDIDFADCDNATLSYAAADPAWGEGGYALSRLISPFGIDCAATRR